MAHRLILGIVGALAVAGLGCSSDESSTDVLPDAAVLVPENTAARCQDGQDNDGDGHVDCADQNCWAFAHCQDGGPPGPDAAVDMPAADLPAEDLPGVDAADAALLPDALPDSAAPPEAAVDATPPPPDIALDGPGLPDAPVFPDAPAQPDAPVLPDAPIPVDQSVDAASPDLPAPDAAPACTTHCDCPQGAFCYYGSCLTDPKLPIYCCAKSGCPPGWWCVDSVGNRSVCPEDPSFPCQDACDCGPAHCCKNGQCVKDTNDPWHPGGTVPSTSCVQGVDPTYCCTRPECHAGKVAYADNVASFRCRNDITNETAATCGGASCFGTACNCGPGESCVDTVETKPPGATCGLLSGGTCVSNAVAEALFGFQSSDLLPCCTPGCIPGTKCEVGWKRVGGQFAYQRVVGTCGSCGDGTCDEGEYPATCSDCSCGDGRCAPEEIGSCVQDCGSCGNGACDPGESPQSCAVDCASCGDGWCAAGESCAPDCADVCGDAALFPSVYRVCGDGRCTTTGCEEPETCKTCPQDCGACEWIKVHGAPAWNAHHLNAVWGSSDSDVFAVGDQGTILHYNGDAWGPMVSGTSKKLLAVWGSSAGDVFAVGEQGTILHFNGTGWAPMTSGTTGSLRGAWGSSATDVYVADYSGAVLRYDGSSWTAIGPGTGDAPTDIWGSSASDIYVTTQAGSILHYDGAAWSTSYTPAPGDPKLVAVWGSSASDIFAVGGYCMIQCGPTGCSETCYTALLHYDGKQWKSLAPGTKRALTGVWGRSASDVFVVGDQGTILRYNGKVWKAEASGSQVALNGVWAGPTGTFVVGLEGTILHSQGNQWSSMASGVDLRGVWGSAWTDVYAVGNAGRVLRFDGATWSPLVSGTATPLEGAWASSPTDVFAAGDGVILHFDGTAWNEELNVGAFALLRGVWGSSATDVFVVGGGCSPAQITCSGPVWHFDGNKWTETTVARSLFGVWGSSATDVYAVGHYLKKPVGEPIARHYQGINHFDGTSWISVYSLLCGDLYAVWGSSPSNVIAVGASCDPVFFNCSGAVVSFDGSAWTTAKANTPSTLKGVWGSSATDVTAVGDDGAIVHYDGSAWTPLPVDLRQPGANAYTCPGLLGVWGASASQAFAVGAGETILRRCPGGTCP